MFNFDLNLFANFLHYSVIHTHNVVALLGSNAEQKFAQWNAEHDTLAPFLLQINGTELDRPAVIKAIRKYYFGSDSEPITPSQLQQITDVMHCSGF